MKKTVRKSYVLVVSQFLLIGVIAILGDIVSVYRLPIIVLGVGIGTLAIITMRKALSVLPDPLDRAQLITAGIYRYIRHPMYTAVLLTTAAMINSQISFLLWSLLFCVLQIKINYEETLLANKFPNYKKYKTKTKQLIPFMY